MSFTLGSLFDGSGTCPLAATLCGITPLWASEIEKYPIAVASARFPHMKHLGDITKISGAEIDPVDIITFGSPCQDLSIAGNQKGLEGSRSGLFFEAIRIINEMRNATHGKYPRFAVWENVPGAYSSNKGDDFLAVLQAFATEAGHTELVPRPAKGRWTNAGRIVGDGFSIAWRTLDAQYWGVPQRRRRIFLVADFRGACAGEILFERKGLRGYSAESGAARKGIASDATGGIAGGCEPRIFHSLTATNARCVESAQQPNCVAYPNKFPPLQAGNGHMPVAYDTTQITSPENRSNPRPGDPCHTLSAGQHPPLVISLQGNCIDRADTSGCNGAGWNDKTAPTLNTIDRHAVAFDCRNLVASDISGTLQAKNDGGYSLNYQNPVCYAKQSHNEYKASDVTSTLTAHNAKEGADIVIEQPAEIASRRYIVRRLTPAECGRLQGFPDGWGDIEDKKNAIRQCAIPHVGKRHEFTLHVVRDGGNPIGAYGFSA